MCLGQFSLEPRLDEPIQPAPELGTSVNKSSLCPSCVSQPIIARATSPRTSPTYAQVGYLGQEVQSLLVLYISANYRSSHISANKSNLCLGWVPQSTGPLFARVVYLSLSPSEPCLVTNSMSGSRLNQHCSADYSLSYVAQLIQPLNKSSWSTND